jgi:hypothetical protein
VGGAYVGFPLENSSNIDLGTRPRAPVTGLWASYQRPWLSMSRMTWKKSPFSKESCCGAWERYLDVARMTRVGGGKLSAALESVGLVMGVEMWWEEWWSLEPLRDFLRAFIVWPVEVQSQKKDKSTSKRWRVSGRALALFHRMHREGKIPQYT